MACRPRSIHHTETGQRQQSPFRPSGYSVQHTYSIIVGLIHRLHSIACERSRHSNTTPHLHFLFSSVCFLHTSTIDIDISGEAKGGAQLDEAADIPGSGAASAVSTSLPLLQHLVLLTYCTLLYHSNILLLPARLLTPAGCFPSHQAAYLIPPLTSPPTSHPTLNHRLPPD